MNSVDREQKISEILDAVIACQEEYNEDIVLISHIAAKAGISTRTLNRYFPDTEIMFFEAAARYLKIVILKLLIGIMHFL